MNSKTPPIEALARYFAAGEDKTVSATEVTRLWNEYRKEFQACLEAGCYHEVKCNRDDL